MICTVDVDIQSANPDFPLKEWKAFKGSPTSIRIRNVPRKVGAWDITEVNVKCVYPDNTAHVVAAALTGCVWVATIPASDAVGFVEGGYSIEADGTDERGNAVTGYRLGEGNVTILDVAVSAHAVDGIEFMRVFDTKPDAPRKGDFALDAMEFYDGETWRGFSEPADYGTVRQNAAAGAAHADDATPHVTEAQKAEWSAKQDELTPVQMEAVNSGINADKLSELIGIGGGRIEGELDFVGGAAWLLFANGATIHLEDLDTIVMRDGKTLGELLAGKLDNEGVGEYHEIFWDAEGLHINAYPYATFGLATKVRAYGFKVLAGEGGDVEILDEDEKPIHKLSEKANKSEIPTDAQITTLAEASSQVNASTALALKDRDCCLVAFAANMTFTFTAKEAGKTGLRSFEVIVTGCVKNGAVNWPAVTYRGDSTDLIPEDGDNHWTFAEQQDGSFVVTRHVANTFTIGE